MTDEEIEAGAMAICREDNPCWSIVHEIMNDPTITALGNTRGDQYRDKAIATITAVDTVRKRQGKN